MYSGLGHCHDSTIVFEMDRINDDFSNVDARVRLRSSRATRSRGVHVFLKVLTPSYSQLGLMVAGRF